MSKAKYRDSDDIDVLRIDEHNLEKEWVWQPSLYYKYATKLADAENRLDEAKADLECTKAELDSDIRSNPDSYGITKVSEKAIENCVPQQEAYQKALEQYQKANHLVRVLKAMVTSLDHRKRALTSLVELHLANYYSEPKLPRDNLSKEALEEQSKRSIRSRARRRREEMEQSDD